MPRCHCKASVPIACWKMCGIIAAELWYQEVSGIVVLGMDTIFDDVSAWYAIFHTFVYSLWLHLLPEIRLASFDKSLTVVNQAGTSTPGIILCMRPTNKRRSFIANERRRYKVTSSLIGWAHWQNDPSHTFIGRHATMSLNPTDVHIVTRYIVDEWLLSPPPSKASKQTSESE